MHVGSDIEMWAETTSVVDDILVATPQSGIGSSGGNLEKGEGVERDRSCKSDPESTLINRERHAPNAPTIDDPVAVASVECW